MSVLAEHRNELVIRVLPCGHKAAAARRIPVANLKCPLLCDLLAAPDREDD